MAKLPVHFEVRTGLRPDEITGDDRRFLFSAMRLMGSWDVFGQYNDGTWVPAVMERVIADDGCEAWRTTVALDEAGIGRTFRWTVRADTTDGRQDIEALPTEVRDHKSEARHRTFTLWRAGQTEVYHLTAMRRMGANKVYHKGPDAPPGIRFACWAPNARCVEVVRGHADSGYIHNDGRGIVGRPYRMARDCDGVWTTDPLIEPDLADFAAWDHVPYMFRVTRKDGSVRYRTDLFSRCQIGRGNKDPEEPASGWDGTRDDVDGTLACSVVVDPEQITGEFDEGVWPETDWTTPSAFWADEFTDGKPVPTRVEDLVIYELHVAALGFGRIDPRTGEPDPGTLADAIALLDYLEDLGVNCIELLPMNEYEGNAAWGYGSSHFLAIEFSGGGRDQMKYFVRACHRRGIAVLLDVVYNHYIHEAGRAQWMYDSPDDIDNIWYWYEGRPEQYVDYQRAALQGAGERPASGHGGYIDNLSTGYAPRFYEEIVRQLFISSAAMLMTEFHIDGFRVDQTTSIHAYAVRHANGAPADDARAFGVKFLREWCRTLKLIKPSVILTAEDHSGWSRVTEPVETGGLGFDAAWYADFYHHLIGDGTNDPTKARLLWTAGRGGNGPVAMTTFASALSAAAHASVVYHESHDEAGNGENTARTIVTAVNLAPLVGETRRWAEARCRVVAALSLLSPGTPMFFMGGEVGAAQPYRYNDFLWHREDLEGLRAGDGARLFAFYQAAIGLRRGSAALRSRAIDIVHVHDANRVIAVRRWDAGEQCLVLASLNARPFEAGYTVHSEGLPDGDWHEVLNSDALQFGGCGVTNAGPVTATGGALSPVLPRCGVVALRHG
ncbi:alpha-amylase family glycosyl hydrolase [Roseospira navarrensis]|uniref:1,4-alpha-glucan branching enzyme n=1 Tax=Roseospira navarrensis TaxID=140058 RepID=A0A7X1ZHY1_9PROT|nr:alpha-amylase family glycosyl hydrolase [Roseospira navarrensis]MQX37560.1 DUF3459 domain-containing protein [Roseospira navarrensis]